MCDSLHNPSGLRYLWKQRGNKKYNLKNFISDGLLIQSLVFEDIRNGRKVLGKIVTSPREGEAYHWPRLQHENLVPLVDIVSINEMISIYIHPYIGRTLKSMIHDPVFLNDPNCFDRKKAYAEDILWALDYLHEKSLCLMNLTDAVVHVCDISDKAVICDFSCTTLSERAAKDKIEVPILYQAPELSTNERFYPTASEMWTCGVMMLQIFTRHVLPFSFIGDEVNQVLKAVKEIDYNTIKETNPGANLDIRVVEDLKEFLGFFLVKNPKLRLKAKYSAISPFLTNSSLRSMVASKYSRKLAESDQNFGYPWPSYQTSSSQIHGENRNDITFKDIYLNEAAKCREKLKRLPGSNTFINLDSLQDGDISKNLDDKFSKSSIWIKSKDLKTNQMYVEDAQSITPKNAVKISKQSNNKDTCKKISNNLENSFVVDEQCAASNFVVKRKSIGDATSSDYEQKIHSKKPAHLNNLNYPDILGNRCISYDNKCVKDSKSPLNVSLDSLNDFIVNNVENKFHKNVFKYSRETYNSTQSLESNDNNQEQNNSESQIGASKNFKKHPTDDITDRSKLAENFHRSSAELFPKINLEETQSDINQSINSHEGIKISYTSFDLTTLNLFNSRIDRNPKFPENPIFDRNCFTDNLNVHFDDSIWENYETIKPKEFNSINNASIPIKDSDSNTKEQYQRTNNPDCTERLEILEGEDVKQKTDDDDDANQVSKLSNVTEDYSGKSVSNIQTNNSLSHTGHSYEQMISEMGNESYTAKHDQHSNIRNYRLKLDPAEEQGIEQNSKTYIIDCPNKASKCENTIKVDSGSFQSGVQSKETLIHTHSEKQAISSGMGNDLRIEIYDQYPNIDSCTTELETTKSTQQKSKKANSKICAENKSADCSSQVTSITESDSGSFQSGVQSKETLIRMHSEKQAISSGMGNDSRIEKYDQYPNIDSCTTELETTKSTEQKSKKANSKTCAENKSADCSSQVTSVTESDSGSFQSSAQIKIDFTHRHSDQQVILPEIKNDSYIEEQHGQHANIPNYTVQVSEIRNDSYIEKHHEQQENILSCAVQEESTEEQNNEKRITYEKNDNLESTTQVTRSVNTIESDSSDSKCNVQINDSFSEINYDEQQDTLPEIVNVFTIEQCRPQYSNITSFTKKEVLTVKKDNENLVTIGKNDNFESSSHVPKLLNTIKIDSIGSESCGQINEILTEKYSNGQVILSEMRDDSNVEEQHNQHSDIRCSSAERQIGVMHVETCDVNYVAFPSQVYNRTNIIKMCSGGSESNVQINDSCTPTHSEQTILLEKGDYCSMKEDHDQHANMHNYGIKVESTEQGIRLDSKTYEGNGNVCLSQVYQCGNMMNSDSEGSESGIQTNKNFTQTNSNEKAILSQMKDVCMVERYRYQDSYIRGCVTNTEATEDQGTKSFSELCEENSNDDCKSQDSEHAHEIVPESEASCGVQINDTFTQTHSDEYMILQESGDDHIMKRPDQHLSKRNYIMKVESVDERNMETYLKSCSKKGNVEYPFQVSKGINTIEGSSRGFETRMQALSQRFFCEQPELPETERGLKVEEYDAESNTCSRIVKLESTEQQDIKTYPNICGGNYNVECPFQVSKGTNTMESNSSGFETRDKTSDAVRQRFPYKQQVLPKLQSKLKIEENDDHSNMSSFAVKLESTVEKGIKAYPKPRGESYLESPFQISKGINTIEGNSGGFETRVQTFYDFSQTYSYQRSELLKKANDLKVKEYNHDSNIRGVKLESIEEKSSKPNPETCGENRDAKSQEFKLRSIMDSEFEGSHRKNCGADRRSSYEEAILLGTEKVNRQQIEASVEVNSVTPKDELTLISLSSEPHNSNNIDNKWKIYRDSNSKKDKRNVLDKGILNATADTPILNFPTIASSSFSFLNAVRYSAQSSKIKPRKFFRSRWIPFLCLGSSGKSKKNK